MQAVYDLSRYPANFNFIEFLSAAKAYGATHIRFDDSKGYKSKFSPEITKGRVNNILIPACALAGMTYDFGPGKGIDPGYKLPVVFKAYQETGTIGRLVSVLPRGTAKYTVTIRDYDRYPDRNSDRNAWEKFAKEVGAVVIDEYYKKPISLHERMALYAGADMNYFVGNGPASLCLFSHYPFVMFMKTNYEELQQQGVPFGGQVPWMVDRQHFVWEQDDYYQISKAHKAYGAR